MKESNLLSRREILRMGVGAGLAAGCPGCLTGSGGAAAFDDSLTVFLSDIHLCGRDDYVRWLYTREELKKRVAEILAMRPRPRRVVTFGDLAFGVGDIRDYRLARTLLQPLADAGIAVVHGMGNHDCRNHFLEVFPDAAKDTPVAGRIVREIDLGTCDLVLLDSLQGDEPDKNGACNGELSKAVQEYVADTFPKRKRPFFAGAHHSVYELRVGKRCVISALKEAPFCVGWIHGHAHNWMKEPLVSWGEKNQDTVRMLTLPSAGLWGDIGSVAFRTFGDHALATLDARDYWFNDALHPGERKPETWRDIVAENQGQFCRFSYERPWRK